MKLSYKKSDESGFILALTITVILILTAAAILVLSLGANQKQLADQISGKRMVAYYRSQAGLVDAQWRIKANSLTLDVGGPLTGVISAGASSTAEDFTNDDWDPDKYYINLDNNTTSLERRANIDDVEVDIGKKVSGTRAIDCVGYDTNG